jgi:hypothetical protein
MGFVKNLKSFTSLPIGKKEGEGYESFIYGHGLCGFKLLNNDG